MKKIASRTPKFEINFELPDPVYRAAARMFAEFYPDRASTSHRYEALYDDYLSGLMAHQYEPLYPIVNAFYKSTTWLSVRFPMADRFRAPFNNVCDAFPARKGRITNVRQEVVYRALVDKAFLSVSAEAGNSVVVEVLR